ncbi:hypothetical protein [Streptomyces sp. MAR4 CNX-425]|uniref:hypothetical protein n=1 Tax=Streptomyces sp. MAR4 CNX-425 TaxID=3406343 RepID=UPI003B511010
MSARRRRTSLARRVNALLAAAALLAGSGLVAGSGFALGTTRDTASPSPCDDVPHTNSSSAVEVFQRSGDLKTRPAAECGDVARADRGDVFYAWCYHVDDNGNRWVYGRLKRTQTRGWKSVGDLDYREGTTNSC